MAGLQHPWRILFFAVFASIAPEVVADAIAGCNSGFEWMDNKSNQSPCTMASVVLGACHEGHYNVLPLNVNSHYTPPNSSTADLCSCSWAAYNLLSGCTICQGFDGSITNWPVYDTNCSKFSSDSFFPPVSLRPLPGDFKIPFWSTVDPSTWQDQRFDKQKANALVNEGHPDQGQDHSAKKKTIVGPVVGGVVGGIAAISIAALIAFFIHRRKRKPIGRQFMKPDNVHRASQATHGRSISDLSSKSAGMSMGYAVLQPSSTTTMGLSQVPISPTSFHTHNSSVHSLSYFGSANNMTSMTSPSMTSPSPPIGRQMSPSVSLNPEDIIVPFTLQPVPSAQNMPSDRKAGTASGFPVYDPPNARPSVLHNTMAGISTPPRARFNPPAYSQHPSPGDLTSPSATSPSQVSDWSVGDARPAHRSENSWDSNGSGGQWSQGHSGTGMGSISAIGDVNQVSLGMSPTTPGGNTVATGHSNQIDPSLERDRKQRRDEEL